MYATDAWRQTTIVLMNRIILAYQRQHHLVYNEDSMWNLLHFMIADCVEQRGLIRLVRDCPTPVAD